jgi:hypothetical protein
MLDVVPRCHFLFTVRHALCRNLCCALRNVSHSMSHRSCLYRLLSLCEWIGSRE